MNNAGQVAFEALVSTGQEGIWATNTSGLLTKIIASGDHLQVAPGDNRTVNALMFLGGSGGSDGRASGLNSSGQIAFWASFTDGSSGIFVSNTVATPEPSTLVLAAVGMVAASHSPAESLCACTIQSMKQSAGVLLYRATGQNPSAGGALEVLLVHPSGYYNRRAPWSIPKGLPNAGESSRLRAARRSRKPALRRANSRRSVRSFCKRVARRFTASRVRRQSMRSRGRPVGKSIAPNS